MKALLPLLAAAVLSAGATPASAQGFENLYVSGYFGGNEADDADIRVGGFATGDVGYSDGYAFGATAGFSPFENIRGEAEFAYRENDVGLLNGGGNNGGDVSSWALMVNGFYDFDDIGRSLDLGTAITPYVGGGIGLASVSWNGVTDGGAPFADDDTLLFAYQLGGGLAIGLFDEWSLSLDYRYFATTDPELDLVGGGSFETEYQNHTVSIGVRYQM